jgi:hypothetical protein
MPCPYFMPTERTSLAALPHPERLSLGDAYSGQCTAANVGPTPDMLHDCNLGYAACEHLPIHRQADAVRLMTRRTEHGQLAISYVCEKHYEPVSRGILTFDVASNTWSERHTDPCIQRMAECCIETFQHHS